MLLRQGKPAYKPEAPAMDAGHPSLALQACVRAPHMPGCYLTGKDTRMADWRKLVVAAILADGKIDDDEVKILKKELWADRKIDRDEVAFLVELRNAAQ